jgi:flagellar biosynthesis protein FlhG
MLCVRRTDVTLGAVSARDPQTGPRVVAIGGGKGGVGKSLLAANMSLFLATLGKRVVLVDASFGAPSLHGLLGGPRPLRTLSEAVGRRGLPIEDVVVDTGIAGLKLIAGEQDPPWETSPKNVQVTEFIKQLKRHDCDFVVIDLASGAAGHALDLFLCADVAISVLAPEPTSLETGYRFLRAAFVRRLSQIGCRDLFDMSPEEQAEFEGGVPAPADFYRRALGHSPEMAARIAGELRAFRPRIVVNLVRNHADSQLCSHLARAIERRFGVPTQKLGYLEHDDAVLASVRRRRPLLIERPESRVARGIERVTRRVLARDCEPVARAASDSFYNLLEVDPTATVEEVRRANRRVRDVYAKGGLLAGGLYNEARLTELHATVDEAYETLMDPVRRKAYDQALFPGGVPVPRAGEDSDSAPLADSQDADGIASPQVPEVPRPPAPVIDPDTEFTGGLMRRVRESLGIDLRAVSERTKIGIGYLSAIEDEDFAKLPAVVYVRGFLIDYARQLRLDGDRLLATYLERYKRSKLDVAVDEP